MKIIIISFSVMLLNLCASAQAHSLSVKGFILHGQADNIKLLCDRIAAKEEQEDTSLAMIARTISHKVILCKNSLDTDKTYPRYLRQLFSNYKTILNLALHTTDNDSAALALNFIVTDLTAKTAMRYLENGDSVRYYNTAPMNVKVEVVDANGTALNGYEVSARPFFMLDAASAFNFHAITNRATENIIPGWYMFIVKKGSVKKEKDFKILRTQTEPVLLTIPVGN